MALFILHTYFVCHFIYLVFVAQLVEALRYKPKDVQFDSLILLKCFVDLILSTAVWPLCRLGL